MEHRALGISAQFAQHTFNHKRTRVSLMISVSVFRFPFWSVVKCHAVSASLHSCPKCTSRSYQPVNEYSVSVQRSLAVFYPMLLLSVRIIPSTSLLLHSDPPFEFSPLWGCLRTVFVATPASRRLCCHHVVQNAFAPQQFS